jgi:hypothetical protein
VDRATGGFQQVPVALAPISHLDVPAGSYVVTANASFSNNSGDFRVMLCVLGDVATYNVNEAIFDFASGNATTSRIPVALTWITQFNAPGTVDFSCDVESPSGLTSSNVFARSIRVTAIQVGGLTIE